MTTFYDANLHEALTRLVTEEPAVSRGWFRWLHNHFLGNHGDRFQRLVVGKYAEGDWLVLSDSPESLHKRVADQELLLKVLNRHAYLAGARQLKGTVLAYWDRLDGLAQASFLAAVTERSESKQCLDMVVTHIKHLEFTPESLCQLACNAVKYNRLDVLELLLSGTADLTSHIDRSGDSINGNSWELDGVAMLSHRLIDMILEAALIWSRTEAVVLALKSGADPNIPIWELQRSCNVKHSPLSYVMSLKLMDLVEILLQYGASPSGTTYAGKNLELNEAISKGWDELAERLIANGASLKPPDTKKPCSIARGSEHEVIGPGGPYFFGHFREDLLWAHNVIGKLIPLVPIAEKQTLYWANAQGGQYRTILCGLVCNIDRFKRYEALGLDTRLTAQEFCSIVKCKSSEGLSYLLSKYGDDVRDKVFAAIRERNPEFGAAEV